MTKHAKLSRRNFLQASSVAVVGVALTACSAPPTTSATPTPILMVEVPVTNADEALTRLLEGNQRYAANKSLDVNESVARRTEVAQGQDPFATIFSCVDSRVPPELIFDRGLGDLFVIRTAGHVIDRAVLGSLEFGVAELQIPLLMVLGHDKCGAVKATIELIERNTTAEANIGWLVEGIRPALEQVKGQAGDELDNTVKANIELTVKHLRDSELLAHAIAQGKLKIIGAYYDLHTGIVAVTVP